MLTPGATTSGLMLLASQDEGPLLENPAIVEVLSTAPTEKEVSGDKAISAGLRIVVGLGPSLPAANIATTPAASTF